MWGRKIVSNKEVEQLTDTELLKEKIEGTGLKLQFIASKLGITRFALANKINNENEFKASEIVALCKVLHITSPKDREAIFFTQQGELESRLGQGDEN